MVEGVSELDRVFERECVGSRLGFISKVALLLILILSSLSSFQPVSRGPGD